MELRSVIIVMSVARNQKCCAGENTIIPSVQPVNITVKRHRVRVTTTIHLIAHHLER